MLGGVGTPLFHFIVSVHTAQWGVLWQSQHVKYVAAKFASRQLGLNLQVVETATLFQEDSCSHLSVLC